MFKYTLCADLPTEEQHEELTTKYKKEKSELKKLEKEKVIKQKQEEMASQKVIKSTKIGIKPPKHVLTLGDVLQEEAPPVKKPMYDDEDEPD